jgi:hypothetical protein
MRRDLVVAILSVMAAAAFGSAQSAVAVNPKTASAGMPAVYDQVKAPTCSGGPPGADQIRYDDGCIANAFYFYDRRPRYVVRMDPAYYPAIVAQCDIHVLTNGDPYWPWPDAHHDSIYVQIWLNQDGDSVPDSLPVWSAWAQLSDSASDTATLTVPVPLGQVICDTASFWVGFMMDTANQGAGYEGVPIDPDSNPNDLDHQYTYSPPNVWSRCGPGAVMLIRSWTMRQGVRSIVVSAIEVPSGQIWAGDTVIPEVLLANLGAGADSSWVWMRIEDTRATDNYIDSCWVRLDPLQTLDTTYRAWSPLYAGVYRMQCTTERNDTSWTYFTVLAREGVGAGVLPPSPTRTGIEVGPNPIRSAAAIRYSVTGKSRVALRILDVRGTVVRTLVAGSSSPGEHLAVWDTHDDQGHQAARGIYFVRLESQDCQETQKVILTR